MSKDVECPYCEHWIEICHDDGFGYEQGVNHEMQCPSCDKNFVFQTEISFSYEAQKADCLNGIDHDYQLTHTFPKEASKMRCNMCDKERPMTEQERTSFGIDTLDNYFEKLKAKNYEQ